jgi:spore coat protein U-like protein
MRMHHWLLVFLVVALIPMRAHAAESCTYTPGTMDFGTLTSPVPLTNNTPNPTLSCTGGPASTTQSLCMAIGQGSAGGSLPRLMKSGANTLQYQIYFDAAHSIPWGDNVTNGSGQLIPITLNGAGSGTVAVPLYGQIPAQTVNSGTYTSTGLAISIKIKPGGSPCSSNSGTVVTTTSLDTKVIISASCAISASNINFGTLTSLGVAQNVSGNLSVTCTNLAPYTIAMSAGSTAGNTIAARKMSLNGAGAGVVSYQLYRDGVATTLWGDGTTGAVYSGTGSGSAQTVPVFAQEPAQTTPTTGVYKDTMTATISY